MMNKWDGKNAVDAEWSQINSSEKGKDSTNQATEHQQGQLIVLEREHQRFYDKLRKKIEELIKKQTGERMDAATKYILLAPDLFVLFARLIQDKRVSTKTKAIAGMVVAYFISPIDIIPEIITGPLGFLDDIILASYALSRILNDVDKSVVLEHWNGEADLLEVIQDVLKKAEDLVDKKVFGAIKNFMK